MTDETMALADEPETEEAPAIETQEQELPTDPGAVEAEAETESEIAGDEQPEGHEQPAEQLETIEFDGKSYQVPKELKSGFMMQGDYTRKTQEVAEQRRELEQRAQAIAQQTQASEEELKLRTDRALLEREIQQFEQMDWAKLENDDIFAAQSQWRRYQMVKDAHARLAQHLDQQAQTRAETAKQESAKRLQETRKFAETQIPGWNDDIDAKVTEFATKTLGFDQDTLVGAYTPQVYRALHLAWLGHQALTKQSAQPRRQTPAVAPTSTVGGKGNPSAKKSLADMSMDEYVAYRSKGGQG